MKIIKTIPFNSKNLMPKNPDCIRVYVDMTNEEFEEFKKKMKHIMRKTTDEIFITLR